LQSAYAAMAESYFRLALQAERNARTDIVYETPAMNDPQPASG
jgi:hypothetical protein